MRHDIKTLNFNGDVYNLSAFALTPGDVNAVSLDFGWESAHMYDMFDEWQSRIVKTNVMETHFPLITSDYYMIGSILYKDFFQYHLYGDWDAVESIDSEHDENGG